MNWLPFAVIFHAVLILVICRVLAGVKLRDRLQRQAFNERFDQ